MKPTDYPIMEDFYKLCEEEFYSYDKSRKYLYTEETLQEVCLGVHSMCAGAESKYFNGHSNITDDAFLVFGVKGLIHAFLSPKFESDDTARTIIHLLNSIRSSNCQTE